MIVGLIPRERRRCYQCYLCGDSDEVVYWVRVNDPVASTDAVTVPYCEDCATWYGMQEATLEAISKLREAGYSPGRIASILQFKSVLDLVATEVYLLKGRKRHHDDT